MSKCPVCKSECDSREYYDDSLHMVVEAYEDCKVCGYYHEFAYGFGREFIGDKEFKYNHIGELYINEEKVNCTTHHKKYQQAIKKERKKLYRNRVLKSRVD